MLGKLLKIAFFYRFVVLVVILLAVAALGCTEETADYNKVREKATRDKDLDEIESAIKKGADVNAKRAGIPLLFDVAAAASESGDMKLFESLFSKGVDVHAKDPSDGSVLAWICFETGNRHLNQVVQLLLDKGVDVNAANRTGRTALMCAAMAGHADVVKTLLSRGANVHATLPNGNTALFEAIGRGDAEVLALLLKAGADPYQENKTGISPLDWAKKNNRSTVVKLLEEGGTQQ
jgi:ankyrin repeat protein